jgi:hypothetical protein
VAGLGHTGRRGDVDLGRTGQQFADFVQRVRRSAVEGELDVGVIACSEGRERVVGAQLPSPLPVSKSTLEISQVLPT